MKNVFTCCIDLFDESGFTKQTNKQGHLIAFKCKDLSELLFE